MRKILMTSAFLVGTALFSTVTNATSIDIYPKSEEKGKQAGYEVEVHYQGDLSELTGAVKKYEVTESLEIPTVFGKDLPSTNKIKLEDIGKKYVHVKYQLTGGKEIYVLGGPYNVLSDSSVVRSIEITKDTTGKYSVVGQTDSEAKIESVKLGSNSMTKEVGSSVYKIDGLSTKPTKLTVTLENGQVEELNIQEDVLVEMGTYDINEKYQRGPINVSITAGTGDEITYKIDGKVQNCGISSCVLNINENGTLGIYSKRGKVTTGILYSIKNIDKAPLDLVLSGKRSDLGSNKKTVRLEWNYPITSGKAVCKHDGVDWNPTGVIEGRMFDVQNAPGSLECHMEGMYANNMLTSNKVFVSAIHGNDFSDSTKYRTFSTEKVKKEESRVGDTYYINSGSGDQKRAEVTLPIAAFK